MSRITNIELFKEYLSKKYPDGEYQIMDGEVFTNSKTKINILHKKCGYIVKMSSHDFIVNHKCAYCNKKDMIRVKSSQTGKKKKFRTADEYKKLLLTFNEGFIISGIENVYNGESYVGIKCPDCGLSSHQKVKYLIKKRFSCRSCSRKIPVEIYEKKFKMQHPNFYSLITDHFNEGIATVKCNICGKESTKNIHKLLASRNICSCENELNFKNRIEGMYDSQFEYIGGYINMHSKVKFRHTKCGREFEIRASHYLYDGCNCTRCKTYKNEEIIKEYLESLNIKYESQKTFEGCKFKQKLQYDIFIPEYNLLVEYDGEGHFKPIFTDNEEFERVKLRDSIKNEFAIKNKMYLLRIPYWRKDEIVNILTDAIHKISVNEYGSYESLQNYLDRFRKEGDFKCQ